MAYPTRKPTQPKILTDPPEGRTHTKKAVPRGSRHTGHAHPFAMVWLVAA